MIEGEGERELERERERDGVIEEEIAGVRRGQDPAPPALSLSPPCPVQCSGVVSVSAQSVRVPRAAAP